MNGYWLHTFNRVYQVLSAPKLGSKFWQASSYWMSKPMARLTLQVSTPEIQQSQAQKALAAPDCQFPGYTPKLGLPGCPVPPVYEYPMVLCLHTSHAMFLQHPLNPSAPATLSSPSLGSGPFPNKFTPSHLMAARWHRLESKYACRRKRLPRQWRRQEGWPPLWLGGGGELWWLTRCREQEGTRFVCRRENKLRRREGEQMPQGWAAELPRAASPAEGSRR